MNNSIVQNIENIYRAVDYIVDILPANKEQIILKAFECHPDGFCPKNVCQIKEFLDQFNKYLQSIAEKLDKDFLQFERVSCDYKKVNKPITNYNEINTFKPRTLPDISYELTESKLISINDEFVQPIRQNDFKTAKIQPKTSSNNLDLTPKQVNNDNYYDQNYNYNNYNSEDYLEEDTMVFNEKIYSKNYSQVSSFTTDIDQELEITINNHADKNNNVIYPIKSIDLINLDEPIEPTIVENVNIDYFLSDKIANDNKDKEMQPQISPNYDMNNCINKKTKIKQNKKDRNETASALNKSSLSGADKVSSGLISNKSNTLLKYVLFSPAREYKCWITHVKSPMLLWVQQQCYEEKFNEMEFKINQFYNTEKYFKKYEIPDDINEPMRLKKDVYVAARFVVNNKYDNKWYRARVIEVDEKDRTTATIFYIDYGNSQKVLIEDLRFLIEKFITRYPAFATPLTIKNLFPVDGNDWSESAIDSFKNFLCDREAEFVAAEHLNWPILLAKFSDVIVEKVPFDVLDYSVKNGLAKEASADSVVQIFKKQISNDDKKFKFKNYVKVYNEEDKTFIDYKEQKLSQINDAKLSQIDEAVNEYNSSSHKLATTEYEIQKILSSNQLNASSTIKRDESFISKISSNKEIVENVFIHEGKNFITSFEKHIKLRDLPKKTLILDHNANLKIQVIGIKNPYKFYAIETSDNHKEYGQMIDDLNHYYSTNETHLLSLAEKIDYNFVIENFLCVAKSPETNKFYRACIKKNLNYDDDLYLFSDDIQKKQQSVSVFGIDSGVIEEVDIENLFPIAKEFCVKPPHCFCCSLDCVEPVGYSSNQFNEEYMWPDDAIASFKELVKLLKTYYVELRSDQEQFKVITCDLETPLKVIIINDEAKSFDDPKYLNDEFVLSKNMAKYSFTKNKNDDEGLSDTASRVGANKTKHVSYPSYNHIKITDIIPNVPDELSEKYKLDYINKYIDDCIKFSTEECLKKESIKKIKEKPVINKETKTNQTALIQPTTSEPIDDLDTFKPNEEHYDSIRNAYFFNEKSYEAHNFGYETKFQGNICRTFTKYGNCNRPNCPFLHHAPNDELVFSTQNRNKKLIVPNNLESLLESFEANDQVLLNGVSFIDPNIATANIIGHYNRNLKRFILDNKFPELTSQMNKYYENKKFNDEKSTFYTQGQIVVAKNLKSKNWLRATICTIIDDDNGNIDKTRIHLYYDDLGYYDTVSIKQISGVKDSFTHHPTQSVRFELENITITKLNEFKEFLDEISEKCDYFYAIIKKIHTDLLEVCLFYHFEQEVFNLNQEIIKLGYGFIRNKNIPLFRYIK